MHSNVGHTVVCVLGGLEHFHLSISRTERPQASQTLSVAAQPDETLPVYVGSEMLAGARYV